MIIILIAAAGITIIHLAPGRSSGGRRELLVRECSFPEPFEVTNHTTPAQAGKCAKKCECEARGADAPVPAGAGARG
ncbi:MAG: hypothetical protein NTV25_00460 [Methanothrix sp.]|nr:hypothetical protein [Methanothrix sp.]